MNSLEKLIHLQKENAMMKMDIDWFRNRVASLEDENERLNQELKEKQTEIDMMKMDYIEKNYFNL